VVLVLVAGACHRNVNTGSSAAAPPCEPGSAVVVARDDLQRLPGTYELIVVPTTGSRTGVSAHARLTLRAQEAALQTFPVGPSGVVSAQWAIGSTDLLAADVGAVVMGSAAANAAAMPGVGVYVTPPDGAPRSVVMRVGENSNARGPQALDAGYFALHVQRVAAEGIWGVWMSGDGTAEVARGHFCATRQAS